MSPSIYLGCQIQNETFEAVSLVNGTLRDVQNEADTLIADLKDELDQLTGDKIQASVILGDSDFNKVEWTAVEEGAGGNEISIQYAYRGPDFVGGVFTDRPPSAEVTEKTIVLILPVASSGHIDPTYNTATTLAVWMSDPDVAELVTSELVGDGSYTPIVVPTTFLSGGKGAPLKDAEQAADEIAKQFGKKTYQDLMRSVNIPVVESDAEAVEYLESVDDDYVIINKKLFLVEGTNLVGIRVLYNALGQDVDQLKIYLQRLSDAQQIPHLFLTQNVEYTSYENVCGEVQPLVTVREVFRSYNRSLEDTATTYADGDVSKLNGYILWVEESKPSLVSYNKISYWGYDDLLVDDIMAGETPVTEEYIGDAQIPVVATVEDPELFSLFSFTDDEIDELLKKDAPGIKPPAQDDATEKAETLQRMLQNNRPTLPNGMRTKIKKPIVAAQAIDLSKTGNDADLAKELTSRGKACARQQRNMVSTKAQVQDPDDVWEAINSAIDTAGMTGDELQSTFDKYSSPQFTSPNVPGLDLPNLPFDALPALSKKIESAYAALSSVASTATKVFDRTIGSLMDIAKGVLNKLQNMMSMTENLLNNDLAECLLGSSTSVSGQPDIPLPGDVSVGGAGSIGGSSGLGSISIGGIPIPMSLLGDALKELSDTLDETLTSAFESIMKTLEKPLCMVNSLMNDLLGSTDLGSDESPCQDGKDPNKDCDPKTVQGIMNDSTSISAVTDTIPHMDLFPKTETKTEVTEEIQNFTGQAIKTAVETTQEITRGVQQVMSDITESLNSKLETISKLDKAIKELFNDVGEASAVSDSATQQTNDCTPPSIGTLTDVISEVI